MAPEADAHPPLEALRAINENSDDGTSFSDDTGRGYFRAGESRLISRASYPVGVSDPKSFSPGS